MKVIEGYGKGDFQRGNFQRGNFLDRYNSNTGRNWENRRTWRQSRSRERERRVRSHHLVLDWDQEPVQMEIGLGALNVESMIIS